jgi:uncharacterized protein
MADFYGTFKARHVVLPVIHVENKKQALWNAETAKKAGADGVFLISMRGMRCEGLLEIQREVKKEYATWWIGVNLLGEPTDRAFDKLSNDIAGLCVDNAQINERSLIQFDADSIKTAKDKSGWKGLYFGGVAFKYQRHVDNLALAAQIATQYVDVITTSGEGTGSAPDYEKVAAIKASVGNYPIAIASGISPENINKYRDVANCYLVATSLLTPGTENFDYARIHDLVQVIRG